MTGEETPNAFQVGSPQTYLESADTLWQILPSLSMFGYVFDHILEH